MFSSPHSGCDYPEEFLQTTQLDPMSVRSSEDAYVDKLFDCATRHGAPFLAAEYPRAYVDLNRNEDELDPALIYGALRRSSNPRVAAGLGVIPRVVAEGKPIRHGKMPLREALHRLEIGYRPYHSKLAALMTSQRNHFGHAILFDCHSMPHDALVGLPPEQPRPNIVLGDRFGSSCARWIIDAASDIFTASGFVVARNAPFAGGYITQHYGRPSRGFHALQIEIDRSLYMDEERIERHEGFETVCARVEDVISGLCNIRPHAIPLAAE